MITRRCLLLSLFGDPVPRIVTAGPGHARNTINTTIFCQPLASFGDRQYLAWYAPDSSLMLAARSINSGGWTVTRTTLRGNIADAHNGISLGVDGSGLLHVSWDHHGNPLNYVRAESPGSLDFSMRSPMNGDAERRVTYPEFFRLSNGDLLFLYRDGASGAGDTCLKRYDHRRRVWRTLARPLITGQRERNAYTNRIAIDGEGRWHLSWCWREEGDAGTNHDICYAVTDDEGRTWKNSSGQRYTLPITVQTAETVVAIPMRSDLINTGTMTTDASGSPLIATFWRPKGERAPQYHVVWRDGPNWRVTMLPPRSLDFRLSGGGTRRIPMSRPLVLASPDNFVHVVFRDEERGGRISVASCGDLRGAKWTVRDLTADSVGQWEPTHDAELWKRSHILHLFHERVGQGDGGEASEDVPPQPVSVLETTLSATRT